MAFAVRTWPIAFDPDVPIGDWGPLRYAGSLGEGAPWRFEPSYWRTDGHIPGRQPDRSIDHVGREYDLSREQVRDLDAQFRPRALSWQGEVEFPDMDRALAPTSPFTRFCVAIYEWESGL
jgi:hypothetical protein